MESYWSYQNLALLPANIGPWEKSSLGTTHIYYFIGQRLAMCIKTEN